MPDDIKTADHTVATVDDLESLYGEPSIRAANKTLTALDKHCKDFIALSPFLVIGTNGDVSPKGDPAGFVKVLDDNTIAIPDRKGNNRLDGYRNILEDPTVALIFLVPGVNETLRVNGRGEISTDPALLASLEEKGHLPATALVVHVEEAFLHCAKALIRSELWNAEAQVERSALPSAGQMLADHIGRGENGEQQEADYQKGMREKLY